MITYKPLIKATVTDLQVFFKQVILVIIIDYVRKT